MNLIPEKLNKYRVKGTSTPCPPKKRKNLSSGINSGSEEVPRWELGPLFLNGTLDKLA